MAVSIMALHIFYYNFHAFYLSRLYYTFLFIPCKGIFSYGNIEPIKSLTFSYSSEGSPAWKSCLKVSLLNLGPSCPPQTVLLGYLVRCGSLLQIVMTILHTFLKFETCRTAIKVWSGLPHPTQQVKIQKSAPNVITICSGLSHPTGWTGPFFQGQRGPLRI